jgi:uncharacterized membrane protein
MENRSRNNGEMEEMSSHPLEHGMPSLLPTLQRIARAKRGAWHKWPRDRKGGVAVGMEEMVRGLLWVSIFGGAMASTLALIGRITTLPPWFTGPQICRTEAGGCQVLFRSRQAALLGIPNAVLGLLFYALLSYGLSSRWPFWILWAGSSLALAMSLWLAWNLWRNRLECRICWAGHVCNVAVWLILMTKIP